MENLGGVHRKLPHLFSAEGFLHQAGGLGPATRAGLQLMILADKYEELKKERKFSHRRTSSRRPSRLHQRSSHAEDARRQTTRKHGK